MNVTRIRFESPIALVSCRLLQVGAAAIICVFSVSPVLAKDLFYTLSVTGAPTGAELIALEVLGNKVTTTDIGPTNGGDCGSLASSPSGTLYSMCGSLFAGAQICLPPPTGCVTVPGYQQLATIDPKSGQATLFGDHILGLSVMAMASAPDGTLYAVGDCDPDPTFECNTPESPPDSNYNSLYTVDVNTGAFTRVGSTGARNFSWIWLLIRMGACGVLRAPTTLPRNPPYCTSSTQRPALRPKLPISWEATRSWGSLSAERGNCLRTISPIARVSIEWTPTPASKQPLRPFPLAL